MLPRTTSSRLSLNGNTNQNNLLWHLPWAGPSHCPSSRLLISPRMTAITDRPFRCSGDLCASAGTTQVNQTGPSPRGGGQACKHAQLDLLTPETQRHTKCCGNTQTGVAHSLGKWRWLQKVIFKLLQRMGKGILGGTHLIGNVRAGVTYPTFYVYFFLPQTVFVTRGNFLMTELVPLLSHPKALADCPLDTE